MAVSAVATLPPFPADCDDVDVPLADFPHTSSATRSSDSDPASRSLDRVSSSDDCCVSSECPSEEEAAALAAALSPSICALPSVGADYDPSADPCLSAFFSLSLDPTGVATAAVSLPAAIASVRATVELEELGERAMLVVPLEILQRIEVSRLERTARDEIKKARALYMRSVLTTAPHRGHGPSVWPRHLALPPPRFHPLMPYTGSAPSRSALRRSTGQHADGSVCHRVEREREDQRDVVDAVAVRRARRVAVTDSITVQAGAELVETDGELASAQWRSISMYAPVRHMVMTSLKSRYGADASDPNGWMCTVEGYAWLDEIFCAVKDAYQMLHNAEAAEWMEIMEQDRLVRKPDWWGRLGFLWA